MITKEEKKLLVEAWDLHHKILDELRKLALMNVSMAYGCIRTAETMTDVIMVDRVRQTQKKELEVKS